MRYKTRRIVYCGIEFIVTVLNTGKVFDVKTVHEDSIFQLLTEGQLLDIASIMSEELENEE